MVAFERRCKRGTGLDLNVALGTSLDLITLLYLSLKLLVASFHILTP